jgi:hypothetical protein
MSFLNIQIIFPILAMILLTLVVLVISIVTRVKEIKLNSISPQSLATRADASRLLKNKESSENLLNLFETPVIFYVICLLFFICNNATTLSLILMWLYVFSRYLHSFIQCSYNQVLHRFYVFILSAFLLAFLLVSFTVNLLYRG